MRCLLLLLLVSVLPGCYTVQGGFTNEGTPQQAGKVAVPLFQGDQDAITDRFISGLIQNGYNVIERSYLEQLLQEVKLTHTSDFFDDESAVELGKLAHADTIIVGIYQEKKKNYQRKKVTKTWNPDKPVGRYDKKQGKRVTQYGGYDKVETPYSRERLEGRDLSIRAIRVKDGIIIFSVNISGKRKGNAQSMTDEAIKFIAQENSKHK